MIELLIAYHIILGSEVYFFKSHCHATRNYVLLVRLQFLAVVFGAHLESVRTAQPNIVTLRANSEL